MLNNQGISKNGHHNPELGAPPWRIPSRIYLYSIGVALATLGLCLLFSIAWRGRLEQQQQVQAAVQANLLAKSVQKAFTDLFVATSELDIRLRSQGFKLDDFRHWAKELREKYGGVDILQLAPAGIIRATFPEAGNESVLGASLLQSKTRRVGVQEAILSKSTLFVGPVVLHNKRVAVIARRPIFTDQQRLSFWGFSIAIAYFDRLATDQLQALDHRFHYRLQGYDPDAPQRAIVSNAPAYTFQSQPGLEIILPNGRWTLWIVPRWTQDRLFWGMVFFAVVLAGFLGWLIFTRERVVVREQWRLEERNGRLAHMAQTDGLTGLLNRRAFLARSLHALEPPTTGQQGWALLFFDVDWFKSINDRFGHEYGDAALVATAHCMQQNLRQADLLARFGGEEFVALINSIDLEQALAVAEKIRQAVSQIQLTAAGQPVHLTVSGGVATRLGNEPLESLLQRADKALYQAKASGRNRCVVAPSVWDGMA